MVHQCVNPWLGIPPFNLWVMKPYGRTDVATKRTGLRGLSLLPLRRGRVEVPRIGHRREEATAVRLLLGVAGGAVPLHGVGRHRPGLPCGLHRCQHVLNRAAGTAGESGLLRDRAATFPCADPRAGVGASYLFGKRAPHFEQRVRGGPHPVPARCGVSRIGYAAAEYGTVLGRVGSPGEPLRRHE